MTSILLSSWFPVAVVYKIMLFCGERKYRWISHRSNSYAHKEFKSVYQVHCFDSFSIVEASTIWEQSSYVPLIGQSSTYLQVLYYCKYKTCWQGCDEILLKCTSLNALNSFIHSFKPFFNQERQTEKPFCPDQCRLQAQPIKTKIVIRMKIVSA